MKMPKKDSRKMIVSLDPEPNGEFKILGGSRSDDWNLRLSNLAVWALPIQQSNSEAVVIASRAVCQATMDIAPADPIEGMLVAQLMAANEAALSLYRKGWQNVNVPEYFEGGRKFLQLADRAARTVVLLTERLDHHRGRGQQQITVKHVTVNADQAIVGNVEHHQGVGSQPQSKDQPHAITYAPGITVPSTDQKGEPVPVAGDEKRAVPDARRDVTGRPEGK
jgi:hypothetical protein